MHMPLHLLPMPLGSESPLPASRARPGIQRLFWDRYCGPNRCRWESAPPAPGSPCVRVRCGLPYRPPLSPHTQGRYIPSCPQFSLHDWKYHILKLFKFKIPIHRYSPIFWGGGAGRPRCSNSEFILNDLMFAMHLLRSRPRDFPGGGTRFLRRWGGGALL